MFKSAKVRLSASLFFVTAMLCGLALVASPIGSDAQSALVPWAYLPYVSKSPPPPIIEITYVYVHDGVLPAAYEYVRIGNLGGSPQNMTNWRLTDETPADHTFIFPEFTLQAGAQVEIYTRHGNNTEDKLYWNSDSPWPVWSHGDTAFLYDQSGASVDVYPVP